MKKDRRSTIKNISEMNMFQYVYYDFIYWGFLSNYFKEMKVDFIHTLRFLMSIVCFPILPFIKLYFAYDSIKYAKREVEKSKKFKTN